MPRKSRDQDLLLLEAGKSLLPEVGASGMSLKAVAQRAGVNLGMFHYHFKTKAAFVQKVLESLQTDIRRETDAEAPPAATAYLRLEQTLLRMAMIFRSQRRLALALYKDVLNGDEDITAFLRAAWLRQLERLHPLIVECQEGGTLVAGAPADLAGLCLAAFKTPVIVREALGEPPPDEGWLEARVQQALRSWRS